MSKADPRIKGDAPLRDLEAKQREDYATSNYAPLVDVTGSDIKRAEEAARKPKVEEKKKKVANFDVNYISDEDFKKELDFLPYKPQADVVLLLGPRINVPKNKGGLELPEATVKQMISEELDKLGQAFRVVAISQKAGGFDLQGNFLPLTVEVGDYIIYKGNFQPLNVEVMSPLSPELAYYQVRYMDVQYSMTQEAVERFKPAE